MFLFSPSKVHFKLHSKTVILNSSKSKWMWWLVFIVALPGFEPGVWTKWLRNKNITFQLYSTTWSHPTTTEDSSGSGSKWIFKSNTFYPKIPKVSLLWGLFSAHYHSEHVQNTFSIASWYELWLWLCNCISCKDKMCYVSHCHYVEFNLHWKSSTRFDQKLFVIDIYVVVYVGRTWS